MNYAYNQLIINSLTEHMFIGDTTFGDSLAQGLHNSRYDVRLTFHERHRRCLQRAPNTVVALGVTLIQFNGSCWELRNLSHGDKMHI